MKIFTLSLLLASSLFAQSINTQLILGNDLNVARMFHISVCSGNSIYFFGGHTTGFVSINTAERRILNPFSNTNISQISPRDNSGFTKLNDGRYYLAGGAFDLGVPAYISAEIFNPVTNQFTQTGDLLYARMWGTAATLQSGKVLISGAWYNNQAANIAEIYDPATGTNSIADTTKVERANPVILPTSDGGAIIFSGYPVYGGDDLETVEYYNSVTNEITILRDNLVENEPGWYSNRVSTRTVPVDNFKMQDGRYAMILDSGSVSGALTYKIAIFNPADKSFNWLALSEPLPTSNEYRFYDPVLDPVKNVLYLPGVIQVADIATVRLFAIELSTGKVLVSPNTHTLASGYYFGGSTLCLDPNGNLLFSGGRSAPNNFNASSRTFTIVPNYVTDATETTPSEFKLSINCFPNPFNNSTNIKYTVNTTGLVQLEVFDILGVRIKQIVNEVLQAGEYTTNFEAKDFTSGTYIVRLINNGKVKTEKIIYLK
ncbi:MAG: T9SS type A sorting domain-containing protein [Ignavibacteriaceae bacterium]|nr:T9SS type A sorting domain-containing protein [Ignavibacteriaceae bacterium]